MAGLHVARQGSVDDLNNTMLPHDDDGPQLNFTIWLLAVLSFGFLSLRIYCKFLRGRGLWWDDYVLVAAWVRLACPPPLSHHFTHEEGPP